MCRKPENKPRDDGMKVHVRLTRIRPNNSIQSDLQRASPTLRGRAPERAGEWWRDIWRGNNLLGRFFRRHFFTVRECGAAGRVYQAAVLDNFFNLRAIERLVLKQCFGDDLQLVAMGDESLFGQLISLIE